MSRRFESCLVALLTAACAKEASQSAQQPPAVHAASSALRYIGSSTIGQGAMPELVKAFQEHTGIKFAEVKISGSVEGFKAVMDGEAPIAGMSRGLKPAEKAQNPYAEIIGYDAIGVFVNERSPISNLTKAQLKALFSGAAKDWKDVGGPRGAVQLVTELNDGHRATIQFFQESVLEGAPFGKAYEIELPLDDVRYVVDHPEAITFASFVFLQRGAKLVKVNGVAPSEVTIHSGEYPLVRPLLLVSKAPPEGDAKKFFDFVLSPAGQAIVGHRFVPRGTPKG
jgi:phosphate transport system substrate-binding protein